MIPLPWKPLFTILRSGNPELTIFGIISVIDGHGCHLLSVGETDTIIWSRSLLKPWQLLMLFPILKNTYPLLKSAHFAMMMASHNAEYLHVEYLQQIFELSGINEVDLKCPAHLPHSSEMRPTDKIPRRIFHPCSGKHLAYLMAHKAQGGQLENYLSNFSDHFKQLIGMLAYLLHKDLTDIPLTLDGCLLPNVGLSVHDMARLYGSLLRPIQPMLQRAPDNVRVVLQHWDSLKIIMRQHPILLGGRRRLDTQLMLGKFTNQSNLSLIAKEGADGLLGLGISLFHRDPIIKNQQLGILIKLASGYHRAHMEIIIIELLKQLGLRRVSGDTESESHIKKIFHFQVGECYSTFEK